MDEKLVNPFIDATLNTLETIAMVSVQSKAPFLKRSSVADGEVTGIIHLTGQYEASVAISFSETAILQIVSTMFGEEMPELNDEIKDAVGEIANMISGQVTNAISELGDSLKAALSEVILGRQHTVPHLGKFPVIAFPFSTDSGAFTLELCFKY